ncbi:hypothetical protein [Streptomyces sp. CLI2509]|uniref:hypothetical protein n=1 Tax=Streptomyces sp. CLI2509 TaxID=1984801 RepID=UPI000BAC8A62|nr:hypothetical protein [Streptomyces sp. CLI2509]ASY37027.1 hypothetical protein CAC01_30790 [Streptomyces sp. CLI2509]
MSIALHPLPAPSACPPLADLVPPALRSSARHLPRAVLLPPRVWAELGDGGGGGFVCVDRQASESAWRRAAGADLPLVTRWERREPAASAPSPRVLAEMLHLLDVPHARGARTLVLGSAWAAGLLAHHLGARSVTAVENDAAAARGTQARLRRLRLEPRVLATTALTPDALGGGLYDRVLVMRALDEIPYSLVRQIAPGGVLVAPLTTAYPQVIALARLVATRTGAAGRFVRLLPRLSVLRARTTPARPPGEEGTGALPVRAAAGPPATRQRHMGRLLAPGGGISPALWAMSMLMPAWEGRLSTGGDGTRTLTLRDTRPGAAHDPSYATIRLSRNSSLARISELGPRALGTETVDAYGRWREQGMPGLAQYGIGVSKGGSRAWVDSSPTFPFPYGGSR